jgi:hypothetical protein
MPLRTLILNPLTVALVACCSSLFLIRVYYHFKPLIPKRVRLGVRRWLALKKREISREVWPILESAGAAPPDWPGWPKGRKFALVLTHDVESRQGVDRVKELAEIEMSLGFRSSFNFIPEGGYDASEALRRWLEDNGFEIGVHDHRHDGKLYLSWHGFQVSATCINHALREWNAVGFRSGFMMRNLNWIQELNINYDSSTFDTDPFEPQPGGANTIFPFWVKGTEGRGYVELPCTLAQDSTLFVLLKERTPEIWNKKLQWIASRGGMALVNVHPDYIAFGAAAPGWDRYPATLYREFLEWVKHTYDDQYWHALPRDVAAYCRQMDLGGRERLQENHSPAPSDRAAGS